MTTEIISLNEYRKNISSLWKKAQKENVKYIVLSHSRPIFEVKPLKSNKIMDDWNEYTPKNHKAWLKAREDLEKWNVVSFEELKRKYS